MSRDITPYVLKRPPEDSTPRKLSIDYAAALNPQQLAAVTAGDGPSLVIAGAGSGKTRTLVYRVAYLIDSGVDASNILLLTFTRKSAQEMLQRAGELIGVRSERVCGGTFHSVANMLLRRYGRAIGLEPGFTILDRGDAEDLIALVRSQLTSPPGRPRAEHPIAPITSRERRVQPQCLVDRGADRHPWVERQVRVLEHDLDGSRSGQPPTSAAWQRRELRRVRRRGLGPVAPVRPRCGRSSTCPSRTPRRCRGSPRPPAGIRPRRQPRPRSRACDRSCGGPRPRAAARSRHRLVRTEDTAARVLTVADQLDPVRRAGSLFDVIAAGGERAARRVRAQAERGTPDRLQPPVWRVEARRRGPSRPAV